MKKILVTGATGFIGNHIIPLLMNNHHVIATSRTLEKATASSWHSKVEYIPLELREFDPRENYYKYFKQPDLMIHLAWEGLPDYKSPIHMDVNLPVHVRFLQNLIANGLKDLTVTGTCLEYGMQEGSLSEVMPALPSTSYACAKNELRLTLEKLALQNPFVLKWIRLFYMYGKGQNPRSLVAQLEAAIKEGKKTFDMSGGEQVRDFLPIEKVAPHIVTIAMQQPVTGIINCSSNDPVRVKQFVEDYLQKKGVSIQLNTGMYPYPDYEPMKFWGNNSKLKGIQEKRAM